ncbi:MAG: putative manganese transporter [Bacilli bacterium]|nr:putative manganese transporter [Bacilli bacterium]
MVDVIYDTLIDGIKILPFLFFAFFVMEYFEHKLSNKSKSLIQKSGKLGPVIGGVLGAFPQCGFSAASTNLYAARIISIGTLVSVYLSTSDEMLPILLTSGASGSVIFNIIVLKVIVGIVIGFIVDFIFRKRKSLKSNVEEFCASEHCHCDEDNNIFLSSLKHTFNILGFIVLVSFVLNTVIYYLGEDKIADIFLRGSLLGPFISSLIGLIPNCAASVVITELYINGAITFGSAMAGLLTGSGVALMILFRVNKNMKDNLTIISIVYLSGVIVGLLIEFLNLFI